MPAIRNESPFLSSQALGTAINSTKVMKAQQVVKTDDGGEVRTAKSQRHDTKIFTLDYLSDSELMINICMLSTCFL